MFLVTKGDEPIVRTPRLRRWRILGTLRSSWCHLRLALAFGTWLTSPSSAQVASLQIADPVPIELKERVSALLKLQRPHDPDAAIAAAKIEDSGLWRSAKVLLLRVETGCRRDLCMVIVGRVTENAIVPGLILGAGPRVYAGDEVEVIWGAASPPLMFEGHDRSAILAFWGEHGWVIESCAACFPAMEANQKRLEPTPSLAKPAPPEIIRDDTFEQFTRAIGSLR